MHVIADAAAALGSRFNLVFDPHEGCLYHNAYGGFRERPLDLVVGVRTPEGKVWALPFTRREAHFPFVEQFSALTTITYRAVHPELRVELTVRVRAPFYPREARISTAPLHYVDIEVRPLKKFRWEEAEAPLAAGEIVFDLAARGVEFARCEDGFSYAFASTSAPGGERPALTRRVQSWVEGEDAEPAGHCGLRRAFDLSEGPARLALTWSAWDDEPVLQVHGEATPFKYVQLFKGRRQMRAWARRAREEIERRCDFLDALVADWSLGVDAANMAALALHSFLVDTWWTTRKDGDWFSVWEGSCFYHSTIDVEYNGALLYLALWPELLGMLLEEWAEFERPGQQTLGPEGEGTGFLTHDMGSHHVVGEQAYPHAMEVEENANYLLLLAAWAFVTGELAPARKKLPLCRRLAEFIVKADSDGNGIPDRGVANTIDDAGAAMQFGREQVYLAVKTQSALWALAELEQACEAKGSQAERWRAHTSKSIKYLEDEAWLGDHYAVTLTRTTEGLTDPWTGEELPPGELVGWDAYSIYTANGLLHLLLAGLKTPRWKMNRFARDLERAAAATMTPYGCRHSSAGGATVWFSQNMWRDYVAAYFGIDLLNNAERYWDYQLTTGHNWRSSLYYDTTESNNLSFYPRGVTVFGMPLAAAGMRLNRADGQLMLSPIRPTLRVPLLPLVDWEAMRAPVLTVRQRDGVVTARISQRELLEGLALTIVGAELEPE